MMIPIVIMAIESDDDRAYMTDVYLKHRALMLKVAWRYTNDESQVDDIVSESCVALIRHLDSLKTMEEKTLRIYITTTVKNKAIDCYRKRQREIANKAPITEKVLEQIEDTISFDRKIEVQLEIDMVKRLLLSLPEREREVLKLKYFEGKDNTQISEILGVAENSVRRYLMRARSALKTILYEGGVEE